MFVLMKMLEHAKEIERRQWLDDLQKQIEDNKRGNIYSTRNRPSTRFFK